MVKKEKKKEQSLNCKHGSYIPYSATQSKINWKVSLYVKRKQKKVNKKSK